MNSKPEVSVITPVYNGAAFVRRCYRNLSAQTLRHWEWIVVDDGSTDDTSEIVRAIDDDRIRLVRYETNRGRGYARTVAINEASSDWIVVWDVDDLHFPERLERILWAKSNGYDFTCSYAVVVDNDLEVKGTRGFGEPSGCLGRGYVHPTLAMKREIAQAVGYSQTRGVGGIGEDVKISWVLPLRYRGMWIEDALTIYQEEREISPQKALHSNIAQMTTLRELAREGVVKRDREYAIMLLRYTAKIVILSSLRIYPRAYSSLLAWRDYGRLKAGWELAPARRAFIEGYKR